MKKWMGVCLAALCLLTGCAEKSVEPVPTQVTETTTAEETIPIPQIAEQDILNLFNGYAYADPDSKIAVDCAVVTDMAHDLIGVVLYTTEDEEGCSLDFLKKDGTLGGRIGLGSAPAAECKLEYLGNGAFSCQLLHTDGNSYLCEIFYSIDEDGGINFKVTG